MEYINITKDNIEEEHICCAIADKKHQCGVDTKKAWLNNRITEGHVFRKLDARARYLSNTPRSKQHGYLLAAIIIFTSIVYGFREASKTRVMAMLFLNTVSAMPQGKINLVYA